MCGRQRRDSAHGRPAAAGGGGVFGLHSDGARRRPSRGHRRPRPAAAGVHEPHAQCDRGDESTGGDLTITSEMREPGELLIWVTDQGGGLPMDAPGTIFEAFVTTKPQGTGMGLAITRSIVDAHGGRVWASANTGPGATFFFYLVPA